MANPIQFSGILVFAAEAVVYMKLLTVPGADRKYAAAVTGYMAFFTVAFVSKNFPALGLSETAAVLIMYAAVMGNAGIFTNIFLDKAQMNVDERILHIPIYFGPLAGAAAVLIPVF